MGAKLLEDIEPIMKALGKDMSAVQLLLPWSGWLPECARQGYRKSLSRGQGHGPGYGKQDRRGSAGSVDCVSRVCQLSVAAKPSPVSSSPGRVGCLLPGCSW